MTLDENAFTKMFSSSSDFDPADAELSSHCLFLATANIETSTVVVTSRAIEVTSLAILWENLKRAALIAIKVIFGKLKNLARNP